jgi:hypothetical protein
LYLHLRLPRSLIKRFRFALHYRFFLPLSFAVFPTWGYVRQVIVFLPFCPGTKPGGQCGYGMERWHESKAARIFSNGTEEALGNARIERPAQALVGPWSLRYVMSGETIRLMALWGLHSGMHEVTGVSMLTRSFRRY